MAELGVSLIEFLVDPSIEPWPPFFVQLLAVCLVGAWGCLLVEVLFSAYVGSLIWIEVPLLTWS